MGAYLKHISLALFCVVIITPGVICAQKITAVLSSELEPYREAYEGFREIFEGDIVLADLKNGLALSKNADLVVAFGGKAALLDYPSHVKIIYCLAPGIRLNRASIKIAMLPRADEVINRLKIVQPSLKHLTALWISNTQENYINTLVSASKSSGIETISSRVIGIDDLPEQLRDVLRKGSNGLWLPPDPALINERSFSILKDFSWSNNIPLYVPSIGLLSKGGSASVSCDFRGIGRTMGAVVQNINNNISQPDVIYPDRAVLYINSEAAANAGLEMDRNALIQKGAVVQ